MQQIQHFFIDVNLSGNELAVYDKELIHQLQNVLRFRVGEKCVLLDNKGCKANATVTEIHKKEVHFSIEKREFFDKPARLVRLYIAIPKKPSTFEMIVQKATELGINQIIPLDTERCQVHELYKADRIAFIAKEASEQCERVFLPDMCPLLKFADFISSPPSGIILAGDVWDYDKPLKDVPLNEENEINIIIGPEGGLTENEISAVRKIGGTVFLLGKTVLRMETAVIATLSIVQFG